MPFRPRPMTVLKDRSTGVWASLTPKNATPPITVSRLCGRGRLLPRNQTAFAIFARRWSRKRVTSSFPTKPKKNWPRFSKALAIWCPSSLFEWSALKYVSEAILERYRLIVLTVIPLVGWRFYPRTDGNVEVANGSDDGLLCFRLVQQRVEQPIAIRVRSRSRIGDRNRRRFRRMQLLQQA